MDECTCSLSHRHTHTTHLRLHPGRRRAHRVPHHQGPGHDAEEEEVGAYVVQGEVRVGQGQAGGHVRLCLLFSLRGKKRRLTD